MTNTNIDDEKDKFERPNDVVRRFYRRKRFGFFVGFFSSKDTVITSVNKKVNTTKNWEKGERMRGR